MLTRRLILTAGMALVTICRLMSIASAAQASDINGKWAGKMPFSNGTFLEVTFEFKVKGQELGGTVFGSGQQIPLVDGRVNGDILSFKVEGERPQYSGRLSGDQIQMTLMKKNDKGEPQTFSFTLKRLKD
jgi:hypothetical protein